MEEYLRWNSGVVKSFSLPIQEDPLKENPPRETWMDIFSELLLPVTGIVVRSGYAANLQAFILVLVLAV